MNTSQRVVLICGALALLIVLLSTGAYQHGANGMIWPADSRAGFANIWDWQAAIVRSGIVVVATVAVYFAVGSRKL